MTLTRPEMELLVSDLDERLVGLRAGKAFDLGRDRVALDLGRTGYLVLSGARGTGRIHLADGIDKIGSCSAFCGLLRKYVSGSFVRAVTLDPRDRIVEVSFSRDVVLVVFVYGKGLALVEQTGQILGASPSCFLSVGRDHWGDRAVGSQNQGSLSQPRPRRGEPEVRFAGRGLELHREVDAFYRAQESNLRLETARRGFARTLRAARKKTQRLLVRVEQDLERGVEADQAQRFGDLLLSNPLGEERGASQIRVKDWFHDGEDVVVPLDPRRSVTENAQAYYKRARRGRRAAEMAEKRKAELEERLQFFTETLEALDGMESLAQIEEQEHFAATRFGIASPATGTGPPPSGRRGLRGSRAHGPGRRFTSSTGLEIRVGHGAEENHQLTFQWARGRDLWLHVSGRPGPHVIVRARPDGSVDSETLLDAATLALFYVNKDKNAEGEVLYQKRKHIRPVKGAVGRVLAAGAKTLFLRIDTARLSRLLRQRRVG